MIRVTVAYATPLQQLELPVEVSAHASVAIAIRQSGLLKKFPGIQLESIKVGIFGEKTTLDRPLSDGDRVEIYRPLQIDPKQARLLRAKKT